MLIITTLTLVLIVSSIYFLSANRDEIAFKLYPALGALFFDKDDQRKETFLKKQFSKTEGQDGDQTLEEKLNTFNPNGILEPEHLPDQNFMAQCSIFYQLFEYTDDQDAKLILLKQIEEIGNEKEIPLLELLIKDEDPTIAKKSKEVYEKIMELYGELLDINNFHKSDDFIEHLLYNDDSIEIDENSELFNITFDLDDEYYT